MTAAFTADESERWRMDKSEALDSSEGLRWRSWIWVRVESWPGVCVWERGTGGVRAWSSSSPKADALPSMGVVEMFAILREGSTLAVFKGDCGMGGGGLSRPAPAPAALAWSAIVDSYAHVAAQSIGQVRRSRRPRGRKLRCRVYMRCPLSPLGVW